jgi:hypothetical protein
MAAIKSRNSSIPKTNEYCSEYLKGKCKKTKRDCNNKSRFYEECNTYIGNKSLSGFI